jgi:putative acetyltransferase
MLTIIPYEPRYQPDFKCLNVAWISQMFKLEDHDLEQLDQPETHILPNNGQIFLAKLGDDIVGTVAMVRDQPRPDAPDVVSYELAKMSVTPDVQGRGAGQLLAEAALDFARQQGAAMVWLESNRKAAAAIRLYERVGFQEVPLRPSLYTRADICMEIWF